MTGDPRGRPSPLWRRRFERGAKICLSISQHHPEEWQPSWGVRTALTALVPFLATPGNGALGSLDMPDDDRRALAAQSRLAPPNMGSPEGQTVASRCQTDCPRRTSGQHGRLRRDE